MKLLTKEAIVLLDPSDKFRPEKDEKAFRNYTKDGEFFDRVKQTYYVMHTNQTMEYVEQRKKTWLKFDHCEMTIMQALEYLNSFVDDSDPDTNIPNSVHAYQTAERIKESYPNEDWFHLTGLIHDLGKIMCFFGEPQWSTVGDTFPLGCKFSDQCVFGLESFEANPDHVNVAYNSELGVYDRHCGLDNVVMSWGHDEYLFQVLQNHPQCTLPDEAMAMIRYHSFYPWHTMGEYSHLCNDKDWQRLPWIKAFNSFDLYSKADSDPDVATLAPYYQNLIDKYIPGVIRF